MLERCKILLMVLGFFYLPVVVSEESMIFQNISIQSDKVNIDQDTRQLTFKNNLRIKIDNYIIEGSDARLSHKDEKLEIFGKPATIKSSTIDGEAEIFVIYPNKSINLVGNAKLLNQGNLITSNLITYQITSNE
jgi:lipopolysaccharide transport protein LptA